MHEVSSSLRRVPRRSKLDEICKRLHRLAQQSGPGSRLPTTTELCQKMGVSSTTLNRALRTLESSEIICRRNGVGLFVGESVEKKTQCIWLLCDSTFFTSSSHSPFWDLLLDSAKVQAAARDSVLEVHFLQTHSGVFPEHLQVSLEAGDVAGIVSIGLLEVQNLSLEKSAPLVAYAGLASNLVRTNASLLVRQGVASLAKRGCRRIEMWAGVPPYREITPPDHTDVLHTFQETLAACNLEFDPSLFRHSNHLIPQAGGKTTVTQQEQGFQTAISAFDGTHTNPDGIVILDDMMTRGALVAFGQRRIELGRDVQVATHAIAGSDVLLGYENKLLRLEFDPQEITVLLFKCLDDLLASNGANARVIDAQLCLREPV